MAIRTKGGAPANAGWLLFLFSLPARQAAQRVDLWRKLRRYGALPLPTSGYLLPNMPAQRERFEWLASTVRKYKGDASVAQVRTINDLPDERIRQLFREARAKDYEALIQAAKRVRGKDAGAKLARLRRLLLEIVSIDFFRSPLRSRAESLLAEANVSPASRVKRAAREFHGRTWVTRHRPGIDRVSSAWLIRRFIDPKAKFVFGDSPQEHPAAIPYDMFRSANGFGHRGDDCTFETLVKEFAIRDRKVRAIADIIHDADLGDGKFGRSEGAGLDRVLIGWAQEGVADDELLRRGMEMIAGLYESL